MKKYKAQLMTLIGIAISISIFYVVSKKINVETFVEILKSIKIFPFFLMIVVYLCSFGFRGLRSEIMLDPFKNISWPKATAFIIIGGAVNAIFPARLGEVFRAYLTGKKEGISKTAVFGSIAIEHIFDGLVLLVIFSITAIFADFDPAYGNIIKRVGTTGAIFFSIAFAAILFARIRMESAKKIIAKIISPFPNEKIKTRLETIAENLISSTSFLKIDKILPVFIFYTLLIWFMEGAVFVLALYALNLPINWIFAFFALAFTSLGLATPSAPAYVGVFQGLVLMVFSFFGMRSEEALAYSVINNIVMVVPVVIIGLILLYFYKESLWAVAKKNKEEYLRQTDLIF